MKIKTFVGTIGRIDEAVNEFINSKPMNVTDIKFSASNEPHADRDRRQDTVWLTTGAWVVIMVCYEEIEKS